MWIQPLGQNQFPEVYLTTGALSLEQPITQVLFPGYVADRTVILPAGLITPIHWHTSHTLAQAEPIFPRDSLQLKYFLKQIFSFLITSRYESFFPVLSPYTSLQACEICGQALAFILQDEEIEARTVKAQAKGHSRTVQVGLRVETGSAASQVAREPHFHSVDDFGVCRDEVGSWLNRLVQ